MNDRLTCNRDDLHARLAGLAGFMASVLREVLTTVENGVAGRLNVVALAC